MYQRILVPYDGSETSSRGLDEAVGLARLTGAKLKLIHVIDELTFSRGVESFAPSTVDIVGLMRGAGERILEQGRARASAAGVEPETEVIEGLAVRIAEAVVEHARSWGADLIVIGTHGRRGVGRLLLGSDAESIARMSPVPVMLVRSPESAAQTETGEQMAETAGAATSVGSAIAS